MSVYTCLMRRARVCNASNVIVCMVRCSFYGDARIHQIYVETMGVRKGRGKMYICAPLEIETKKQKFREICICRYDTRTAHNPGSLFWLHAVLSLHFTHTHAFSY